MTKYVLPILSAMLLLVTFVVAWYDDVLFSRFWVLHLPIYPILLGWFIALLVASIVFIIKEKQYVNFISLGILLLLVLMVLLFPFRFAKARLESILFEKDRMKVVEMIMNDETTQGYGGNYNLPVGYRRLSSDGRQAYVYWNDGDEQVIGFWVFRGMLSGSVQVIYSTGGEELMRSRMGTHELSRIDKLKENWYYVEMDMDD